MLTFSISQFVYFLSPIDSLPISALSFSPVIQISPIIMGSVETNRKPTLCLLLSCLFACYCKFPQLHDVAFGSESADSRTLTSFLNLKRHLVELHNDFTSGQSDVLANIKRSLIGWCFIGELKTIAKITHRFLDCNGTMFRHRLTTGNERKISAFAGCMYLTYFTFITHCDSIASLSVSSRLKRSFSWSLPIIS